MRDIVSQFLIAVGLIIISLAVPFMLVQSKALDITPYLKVAVLTPGNTSKKTGNPERLKIPSIGVDATIEYVGVNTKGIMDVPVNTGDVGWFYLGTRPGETGSAVIAGHFDKADGTGSVFADLNKLKQGDRVYVIGEDGSTTTFAVQGSREYDAGFADEVFSRNDGVYLNLITCDGVWDGAKKSYNKRLVVFTSIVH